MANPVDFPQRNDVLGAAPGTEKQVNNLYIHRDTDPNIVYNVQHPDGSIQSHPLPRVTSVWEFTDEEIEAIVKNRRVYFRCWGVSHPPIYISGTSLFPEPNPALQ